MTTINAEFKTAEYEVLNYVGLEGWISRYRPIKPNNKLFQFLWLWHPAQTTGVKSGTNLKHMLMQLDYL